VLLFSAMQRPALIVIDMLNDFLFGWPETPKQRLPSSINNLIAVMRRHNCPVIWVRQEFEPDLRDAYPEMLRKKPTHFVQFRQTIKNLGLYWLVESTPSCLNRG
jgi:nicotinamidase-related amidase